MKEALYNYLNTYIYAIEQHRKRTEMYKDAFDDLKNAYVN